MYLIGYYLNLIYSYNSYNRKDDYVLCYTYKGFKFYPVSVFKVSSKYQHPTINEYKLTEPVICKKIKSQITDIYFLSDFENYNDNKENTGFTFKISTTDIEVPTLLYNGKPFIISNLKGKKKQRFAQLLTNYVVSKRLIIEAKKQNEAPELISKWESIYKETNKELSKISIFEKINSINPVHYIHYSTSGHWSTFLDDINNYIKRSRKPLLKVIFTGKVPPIKCDERFRLLLELKVDYKIEARARREKFISIIGQTLEELSQNHFIKILSGLEEGAEQESILYAERNMYEFEICKLMDKEFPIYSIERAYEIAKLADCIIVIGNSDHPTTKNLIQAAKVLNIELRTIEMSDEWLTRNQSVTTSH